MKTVLLIEDNIDILENVAELLGCEGYQAIMATNGYDGVKIARQVNPAQGRLVAAGIALIEAAALVGLGRTVDRAAVGNVVLGAGEDRKRIGEVLALVAAYRRRTQLLDNGRVFGKGPSSISMRRKIASTRSRRVLRALGLSGVGSLISHHSMMLDPQL